jgi:hypothetical protein
VKRAAWLILWLAAIAWLLAGIRPQRPGEAIAGLEAMAQGVLAGQDTIAHDYPAAWWGWRQVRATGRIPLWNPCWFAGEPFVASQTFLPFYPFNWLSGVLPWPLAFNVQYPLHLLLAALAMAWICRRRGLGWEAAGLAALAWGLGGHLATLTGPGHIQKLQALAWLPLVADGLGRLAEPDSSNGDGRRHGGQRGKQRGGTALQLAVGLALQVLAGHPQVIYMSLAAGGAELAARLAWAGLRRRGAWEASWVGWGGLYGRLAGALALAALLSAVMWLPTMDFGRVSNRQGELGWTDAVRGSLPPEESLEFALPRLRGDSMPNGRGVYVGRYGESPTSAPERVVSDYAGQATLLLAALGLFVGRARRRREAAGFLLLAVAAHVVALGGYMGGFYRFMLRVVPGLGHFRAPSAMLALAAYGLAMAAALGVQALCDLGRWPDAERRRRAGWIAAVMVAMVVAFMSMRLTAFGDALAMGARWERLGGGRPGGPAQALAALRSVALLHAGVFGAFAALGVAAVAWAQRAQGKLAMRRRLTGAMLWLLGAALAADLVVNERPFWNAIDARPYQAFMQSHWAMPLWDADAARQAGPSRVLEVGGELKNWAMTYTDFERGRVVSSVHGYHPLAYGDYFRLLSGLGFTHPNFLKLFDVGWLLWPESSVQAPPPGYAEVQREKGLRLLHDPSAQFIHPAGPIRVMPDWKALLAWLSDAKNDPLAETPVLAADAKKLSVAAPTQAPAGAVHLRATVQPRGPDELSIGYALDADAMVVVSQAAVPGWRAWTRRDAGDAWRPAPIGRAAGYFMLLGPLPKGSGQIRLAYDPLDQRVGLWLTLLGLACLGALLVARRGDLALGKRRRVEGSCV